VLVEDKTATPADIAACRIDFAAWLLTLTNSQRRAANLLATGETTTVVAKKVGLTAGRVSQMRRELMRAWELFHGPEFAMGIA
jgi:DNA-binding NarL/FixJ family response regulator